MGDVIRVTIIDQYEKSETFHVHQRLFAAKSPYFAALPNFKEGEDNHVTLSNVCHKVFTILLHWLYEGRFRSSISPADVTLVTWVGVWAAADRLMMNRCKNMAVDQMRQKLRVEGVGPEPLQLVCDLGYSLDSTLGRLFLEQIARDCTVYRDRDDSTRFEVEPTDPEVALALTKSIIRAARAWSQGAIRKGEGPEDPASLIGCHYHEHHEGEVCHLKE